MPPRPAVTTSVPAQRPPKWRRASGGQRLVGALQDALRADVDPRAGRHLAVHRQAAVLEVAEVLPRGPAPARAVALAMSTRGAHGCVRNTPTGLPDCTSSVSSFSRSRSDATMRRRPPSCARRLPGAAVDDQVVGPLGDLGIEVVHQHAQRGFLRPALARERRRRAGRGWCGRRSSWSSAARSQRIGTRRYARSAIVDSSTEPSRAVGCPRPAHRRAADRTPVTLMSSESAARRQRARRSRSAARSPRCRATGGRSSTRCGTSCAHVAQRRHRAAASFERRRAGRAPGTRTAPRSRRTSVASARRARLERRGHAHADVVFLAGRGRDRVDAGRVRERLELRGQRGGRDLRHHEPGVQPAVRA